MTTAATAFTIPALTDADTLSGTVLVEISQLSPTVTTTATTISASATSNSFSDSAGGFISAGFAVGMTVLCSGWAGANTANNKRARIITALSANQMTFGGADGDDITTAIAGDTVVLTAWISRALDLTDLPAGDADAVTYTPAELANWLGAADPGNAGPALDQLAMRVQDLEDEPAPTAATLAYTPADNTDWDGDADPGSTADALDQAAARLTALEAKPPIAVFAGFYPGVPAADALLLVHPAVVSGVFRADFDGCRVIAETAATASTVFEVRRGATVIGTATFAASGTVATLVTTGNTTQAITASSDVLRLVGPATPDATLADISFAFLADR